MIRILGIDYGLSNMGIAISDPLGITAQVLDSIKADHIWDGLKGLFAVYQIDEIVLGNPKNQHGGDSKMSELVRLFKDNLESNYSVKVVLWDERFSSKAVMRQFQAMNMKAARKKQLKDSCSAAYLLQGYLDFRYN